MIRSKTWVKDKYFEYKPGDIVKLVRKKKNGHPRALELGKNYKVFKIENSDLFVYHEIQGITWIKVNKDYFVPIERLRDEIINEIFN